MNARAALTLLVGLVVLGGLVILAANAIHPTLRMVAIPGTILVGIVVLVAALKRASRS